MLLSYAATPKQLTVVRVATAPHEANKQENKGPDTNREGTLLYREEMT